MKHPGVRGHHSQRPEPHPDVFLAALEMIADSLRSNARRPLADRALTIDDVEALSAYFGEAVAPERFRLTAALAGHPLTVEEYESRYFRQRPSALSEYYYRLAEEILSANFDAIFRQVPGPGGDEQAGT